MAVNKRRKCLGFVIHSHLRDSAFTEVKRGAKFDLSKVCERGTICQ